MSTARGVRPARRLRRRGREPHRLRRHTYGEGRAGEYVGNWLADREASVVASKAARPTRDDPTPTGGGGHLFDDRFRRLAEAAAGLTAFSGSARYRDP